MGFLAVLAVALILIGNRLAESWATSLSGTSTLSIAEATPELTAKLLAALEQISGVSAVREVGADEQAALLAPWLGDDLTASDLPLPVMIEIEGSATPQVLSDTAAANGVQAVLDTHDRWRDPLTAFARRVGAFGLGSALVILGALVAIVTLASEAALAANLPVIRTLRLVGASDAFIARAFVRRFTVRALVGALAGTLAGLMAAFALVTSGVLGETARLTGADAPWLLAIPILAAITAFVATRIAAMRTLKRGL
jgi:cell division transport system permease protein